MANREDNIKKINDQLEQLTDEELEKVAGGTYNNTAADTRALNELGLKISPRSALNLFWIPSFNEAAGEVSKIFSKFDISVDQSWGAVSNKYYFKGQEISREQAFKIVADKLKKPLPNLNY